MNYKRLEGKVAIITGAGRGLGRGMAIKFAKEGAKVVLVGRNERGQVEDVVKEIKSFGGEALPVKCNVGVREEVKQAVKTVADKFGRIDILVNNAAIGYEAIPFEDMSLEYIDNVFRVNIYGYIHFMQECFPYFKAQGGGKIINMSSASGEVVGSVGLEMHAAYAMSKQADRGLTKMVAMEWGKYNINVNSICPVAQTEGMKEELDRMPEFRDELLKPMAIKRLGDPENDVGGLALFLASEDSSFITGATHYVDGGLFSR